MFEVIKTEGTARRGRFRCAHGGEVQTPVFMNVGTCLLYTSDAADDQ